LIAAYGFMFVDVMELPAAPDPVIFLLFGPITLVANWALWGWLVGALLDRCAPDLSAT
jgi:hypothetical protein